MRRILLLSLSLTTLGLGGCPKPRSSAATQPTPAAFDAAQSDPNALAVVDAALTKLGGADKWTSLKQLKFTSAYKQDDKLQATFDHAWDRWNGRHYMVALDMATAGGKPEDVKMMEVRHDLFDREAVPWAAYDGGQLMRADAAKQAASASTHLTQDLYFLALIYKMKDPGVMLKVDNAEVVVEDPALCKPSCTSIKVTFDPAVGKDTWFVTFNNDSKLPEVIEMQKGAGRIGYGMTGWVDAGGLKWPTKLQNLGFKGEVIEFADIEVGDVDESLYVPAVGH